MRIVVFSSLPQDTGCWLRATYCAESLKPYADVVLVQPARKGLPLMLDVLLTLPLNVYKALFTSADFLIGFKPFPNVTIPLLLAKYFKKRRVAVDIDDLDFGFFGPVPALLIRIAQLFAPRFFDMVTTHNSALRDAIIKLFSVKPATIHMLKQGVDCTVFCSRGMHPRKNALLYVGHLNIASDLSPIMQAVARVQRERDVTFTVAGGGPREDYFKNRGREMGVQVRFTGHISGAAVAREIDQADVCLVYYSENEVNRYRCSMKLRECLAMGKKVVCNGFADARQFMLYTYQSSSEIDAYAEKVIEVLDGGGDGRELRGAAYVREELNWKSIGRDFFDMLCHWSPR